MHIFMIEHTGNTISTQLERLKRLDANIKTNLDTQDDISKIMTATLAGRICAVSANWP